MSFGEDSGPGLREISSELDGEQKDSGVCPVFLVSTAEGSLVHGLLSGD